MYKLIIEFVNMNTIIKMTILLNNCFNRLVYCSLIFSTAFTVNEGLIIVPVCKAVECSVHSSLQCS